MTIQELVTYINENPCLGVLLVNGHRFPVAYSVVGFNRACFAWVIDITTENYYWKSVCGKLPPDDFSFRQLVSKIEIPEVTA